jgi:hypothetical protein
MTTVREQIDRLHTQRGDFRQLPLTIPGKGHWLWGLYTPIYVKMEPDGSVMD